VRRGRRIGALAIVRNGGGRGRGREGEEERKETSTGIAQKNEAGGGSEAGRGN